MFVKRILEEKMNFVFLKSGFYYMFLSFFIWGYSIFSIVGLKFERVNRFLIEASDVFLEMFFVVIFCVFFFRLGVMSFGFFGRF